MTAAEDRHNLHVQITDANTHIPDGWTQNILRVPSPNAGMHIHPLFGLKVSRTFRPGLQEYTYIRWLDSKHPASSVQECGNTHVPDGWTQSIPRVPSRNAGIDIFPTATLKVSRASRPRIQNYTCTRRLDSKSCARPIRPGM